MKNRKIVTLMALGLMVGALFAPTAAEAQLAGGVRVDCTLAFPNPSGSNVDCTGEAYGVTGSAEVCLGDCGVTVRVQRYSEPCTQMVGFPILGEAHGTLEVNGQNEGTFDWLRVGATAVIVPVPGSSNSAGVGVLVPHGTLGTCEAPNSAQDIEVVAAGVTGLL